MTPVRMGSAALFATSLLAIPCETSAQSVSIANVAVDMRSASSLSEDELHYPDHGPLAFLTAYFPSHLVYNSLAIKSYVRSEQFRTFRRQRGDLPATDAIYLRCLRLTGGNTGLALLYAMLATMDHRIVSVRNPIFALAFPLTNESEMEFVHRIRNLPRLLYADSPRTGAGDRDKLQHFFGSAFLAFVFEGRGPANRVAEFIEWGEDAIIIGGAHDERDVRANRHGQEFGLALRRTLPGSERRHLLPSQFIKFQVAKTTDDHKNEATTQWCGLR